MTTISSDSLAAHNLMQHVTALADVIGPRPAGKQAEMQAREYVVHALRDAGIGGPLDEQRFLTPDSWGYGLMIPTALALAGNFLPKRYRWLGGLLSLFGVYALHQVTTGRKQPLTFLAPRDESGNIVAKIPAQGKAIGEAKHRVVLIGHLDSNKHRGTFTPSPIARDSMRAYMAAGMGTVALNGIAQLLGIGWLRWLTALGTGVALQRLVADEQGPFIPGANDNATAVACLLGIGAHLREHPLENTEVWLAFTGAEEIGSVGMHALLDTYHEDLARAWFIDFEMVGAGRLAWVTEHSSLSPVGTYRPDTDSLVLAAETAQKHPEFNATGVSMMMIEEVGALRSRGFRGICLVGVGEDGWLVNWHQHSDVSANIDPAKIENAARFGLAMLHTLDERQ